MKKVLFLMSIMLVLTLSSFAQNKDITYENHINEHTMIISGNTLFATNTIIILNRTFNVGDTITTTSGSGIEGQFLSIKYLLNPLLCLDVQYINYKFIISKIYIRKDGLNSISQIVCRFINKSYVYIDPAIAITRKEIK